MEAMGNSEVHGRRDVVGFPDDGPAADAERVLIAHCPAPQEDDAPVRCARCGQPYPCPAAKAAMNVRDAAENR